MWNSPRLSHDPTWRSDLRGRQVEAQNGTIVCVVFLPHWVSVPTTSKGSAGHSPGIPVADILPKLMEPHLSPRGQRWPADVAERHLGLLGPSQGFRGQS